MANYTKVSDQQGIIFPFHLSGGRLVLSEYRELIKASILTILTWPRETLGFNPEFGNRLEELIGEPNYRVVGALVKRFLIEALSNYEKRITILDISLTRPTAESLHITVKYKIVETALDYELIITKEI